MMRSLFLAVLVLAGTAHAQDACLTGASLMPDQRALVALRDATEAACPCATYDGSPGHTRAKYQACARGALDDALAASALRAECKKTAKKANTGATCGSTKVACGKFKAGANPPFGCALKPAARCTNHASTTQTACTSETHCADVVDWTAGTCFDPRVDGPYLPGARMITFTKPSAVDPMQTRTLDTAIWYPAAPGSGPINGSYLAVLDAPVDPSGGPYPLVMFSHGSCGYPLQSTFLTARLASYGFIVVAPPHPGNTIYDFPACGSSPNQVSSAVERPQDIVNVLDQMLGLNADSSSPFFGAIDPARLGMSGHSFGGLTTYLVLSIDSRFKVAMPMAPAAPPTGGFSVPSMTLIGAIDAVVNNTRTRARYADSQSPKLLVEIQNSGHYSFSNGCFVSPDCMPPTTLTQDEAHAQVLRYALPFLEVYLAGDSSWAPFLTAAAPGSTLEAAP
jgi:predicted dienelactone hydrolase